VSLVAGAVGAIVVAFAQHYRLRAQAVIKWDTSGRLGALAGDLDQLLRDIEAEGALTHDNRDEFEGRFKALRLERQAILKDDRDRISAATPETIDHHALRNMGIDPSAGGGQPAAG
jgi:hypothetical protein